MMTRARIMQAWFNCEASTLDATREDDEDRAEGLWVESDAHRFVYEVYRTEYRYRGR